MNYFVKILFFFFFYSSIVFAVKGESSVDIEHQATSPFLSTFHENYPHNPDSLALFSFRILDYYEPLKNFKSTILLNKINVESRTKYKFPPLFTACINGDLRVAQYLIEEKGIDVNSYNEDSTPLIAGIYSQNQKLIKYLIQKGYCK